MTCKNTTGHIGGRHGSRLWPLSRELYPKQLLQLIDHTSLLQTTLLRANDLPEILPPLIVVGEEHRFITRSQIEELKLFSDYTILLEPIGRNTAPAICAAAEYCLHTVIRRRSCLSCPPTIWSEKSAIPGSRRRGGGTGRGGSIVTFGITPQYPETGYGYIEKGEGTAVASFKEKPSRDVAEGYLQSGNYLLEQRYVRLFGQDLSGGDGATGAGDRGQDEWSRSGRENATAVFSASTGRPWKNVRATPSITP